MPLKMARQVPRNRRKYYFLHGSAKSGGLVCTLAILPMRLGKEHSLVGPEQHRQGFVVPSVQVFITIQQTLSSLVTWWKTARIERYLQGVVKSRILYW